MYSYHFFVYSIEIVPCLMGLFVFAAACAIGELPNPASFEKIPRDTPNLIAIHTEAPAKPPDAAVDDNAAGVSAAQGTASTAATNSAAAQAAADAAAKANAAAGGGLWSDATVKSVGWCADRKTGLFYGAAFVEMSALGAAEALVAAAR